MDRIYVCGIVIPLLVITYINILGGLLHPHSGERVSLAVTMMLTGAAIYLVVTDTMPKIGSVTLISRLYLSSLIHNFIALVVTIFVVSLHNIATPDPVSDHKLAHTFFSSTDGEDRMDETSLKIALHSLGMRDAELLSACQHIVLRRPSPLSLTQVFMIVMKMTLH